LTAKREWVQMEDQLLIVAELLDLFSGGELTQERIRNSLWTNGGYE